MYVHRSNRIEMLAEVLAELVRVPSADPFAPECIVVQGRGMERWLSMELGRRLGVWANPDFPFPRAIFDRACAAVLEVGASPPSPFEPETLQWAIADILPEHLSLPEFAEVRGFLVGDDRRLKLIQLATRLADTFDQYAVYRPEMVFDWDAGRGTGWQPILWRALVARHGRVHAAARAYSLLERLRGRTEMPVSFPSRLSVFGVSTLPPLYLQVLAGLSRFVEVHLFLLSPSREYWADVRSRREKIRELAKRGGDEGALGLLHLTEAPTLLESLGRVGRDFQQVLEATVDYEEGADLYVDPGTQTVLTRLQSDLLALRTAAAGDSEVPEHDDSIAVHACHGPMREVEVLHDQLVAAFEQDSTLQPQDVVVMSPDIDSYAPFIEAVFGSTERNAIPFRISDRSRRSGNEVMEAFNAILDLLHGRFSASTVLDVIALPPVRERFGIANLDELETVRRWAGEVGVRWGIDEAHRRATGQPECREHTWRFGLDRLLIGYALPGRDSALYRDVLAYDHVEGVDAYLLGCLAECCEQLFALREMLRGPRALARWRDDLNLLLTRTVALTAQNAYHHEELRGALTALAERAERAGFGGPVDLESVRVQLEREIGGAKSPHGFLTGGVTFCELVPMRSIPFRIVCLLGLHAHSFPRSRRSPGFDLIAQQPRVADRNPRDDDRYLFLEALLSARERLIITYGGQSLSDNSELPPSVVVSELLDAIDHIKATPSAPRPNVGHQYSLPFAESGSRLMPDAAWNRPPAASRFSEPRGSDDIMVRHPLNAFSLRYFDASSRRLFSYAHREYAAAKALLAKRRRPPLFLTEPLPPGEPLQTLELDDLITFMERPARRFLERRLGLWLRREDEAPADREPIVLGPLAQWQLGDDLLRRRLRGESLTDVFPLVRAAGRLPEGELGRCAYDTVAPEANTIAELTLAARGSAHVSMIEVDLLIDGVRLTGVLRDVWRGERIACQFSRLGRRQELGHWIRHLVLNAISGDRRSILVGRGGKNQTEGPILRRWRAIDDPMRELASIVDLYRLGQRFPLPLFEKGSRLYVEELRAGQDEERARAAVCDNWTTYFGGGDADEPEVYCLYGEQPPFDEPPSGFPSFSEVARRVYDPFFDAIDEPTA